MLISLIICTYNRADLLEITLPTYKTLAIPKGVQLELIIIDNNSNDRTREVVKTFKNFFSFKLSYFFEPIQGLSHARNTGFKHAEGDYIAYIDDECTLPGSWLEVASKIINIESPAFLGGPYYGKFLFSNTHPWFKESFGDSYILQYNLPDGKMPNGRYLSGGNMIIRQDVFGKIGLFDTSLGMNGDVINYGEEQDFQKRLVDEHSNEVIWYCSELFVWHGIRTDKISISYLFKEALIRGAAAQKGKDHSLKTLLFSPTLLIGAVFRAIFSFLIKLLESSFTQDHFFTLLYEDYRNSHWRDIGGLFEKVKRLFGGS